jgi:hypothetical protein
MEQDSSSTVKRKPFRHISRAEWRRIEAEGKRRAKIENRAVSARYDRKQELVVIGLRNGVFVSIPRSRIKTLRDATAAQIANMQVVAWGSCLEWPDLDDGLEIIWFIEQVVGFKTAYSSGREGGAARSRAKVAAARANGAKGGRPKKVA